MTDWMPDFMKGLAEGINRSRYLVSDAVNRLPLDMKVSPGVLEIPVSHNYSNSSEEKGNMSSKNGLTLYIENFNNYTEKDIEQLAYELEFYRQKAALGKGGV
ncbi:hypothetical protein ACYUJ6_14350 [Clostridium sp. JNZ X4-2]